MVDPVVLGGGLDHGVFATDLVGGQGNIEAAARFGDDVEVGDSGLDHDHVSAFFEVELNLFRGFANVAGIHLVGATVAERRGGIGSFAEGPVVAAGELGGVTEDGNVLKTVLVESG